MKRSALQQRRGAFAWTGRKKVVRVAENGDSFVVGICYNQMKRTQNRMEGMLMRYKENWETSRRRLEAFWHQEVLDRCEAYLVLPLETRKLYNDLWTELGI